MTSGPLAEVESTPEPLPEKLPSEPQPERIRAEEPTTGGESKTSQRVATPPRLVETAKRQAKRGRPPSSSRAAEPVEREKVTLRLRADLVALYRDWSWDERCQFSDLVDRAMADYSRRHEKSQKA